MIQGFNTFLPPGYRIECGTDENPDAIRVTTPSGTMTQSLQSRVRGPVESSTLTPLGQSSLNRQDTFENRQGWTQPVNQQISPESRPIKLPSYGEAGQNAADRAAEEAASLMHQQEQRGVSQLQNAVTAAANGVSRAALVTSPAPGTSGGYSQGQGGLFASNTNAGDLKRGGPVEFNHAISYVNKIKNRFSQQPEIYKQFLEILQTYQRESKPIQDVYGQVTHLFNSAPDLLEDFKQFLPETAAHARAQANARAAGSDENVTVRNEASLIVSQQPQALTPRQPTKLPPLGQFDPPSTSKEGKKRRIGPGGTLSTQPAAQTTTEASFSHGNKTNAVQVGNANKRQKLNNAKPPQAEAVVASPTMIPALPVPLPPYPSNSTTQEELGFFDRARKQISNRSSYNEFLKLINLFTNDLIDKYTLVDRVGAFIGNNVELMKWFKEFMQIEDQPEVYEARIRPDPGRVNLAHCRSLGPSYRHLPKRDQNKTCKGRDGMCYEVLNDVWASHPTWASEDSGFVAHRKNQYEEALHRIEEERHDYDFHIESCQRVIQLMEPIVQQIGVMTDMDRNNFVLAPGLGGASEAIPKRIIMKVYGREVGNQVLRELYARPTSVLPIVLRRLKQKLEEWKSVQREWEKVWRDQINKQFWKSLDHQGINSKNLDKKNFQQKTLTSEIQAKYEEGRKNRALGINASKHQLEYAFTDLDVIVDATRLILVCLDTERVQINSGEQERVKAWLCDFVPKFFGLDSENFLEKVDLDGTKSKEQATPESRESDAPPSFKSKGRKSDWLRRQAIDRRNGKEDSVASESKESTPVPGVVGEMEVDDGTSASEKQNSSKIPWINMPRGKEVAHHMAMDESYRHEVFNLYANANIYCFFRLFETLYSRLLAIKENESHVSEAISRHRRGKPAIELHMIDKAPDAFFNDISGGQAFYLQILQMCEQVLLGEVELQHLEETLRRYYNKTGWQLYTIDKLVTAILRFIMAILGGDVKDKSLDITNLFLKDRQRPDTSRRQEIEYRKQVQKLSKDVEVYRISYVSSFLPFTNTTQHLTTSQELDNKRCAIRLFPPEEPTFDSDALSDEAKWQYYVASYAMTDATEGVDQSQLRQPFLRRNIAAQNVNIEAAYEEVYGNLDHFDNQEAFISPDTYRVILKQGFAFWRVTESERLEVGGKGSKYKAGEIAENHAFREKIVDNKTWWRDLPNERVAESAEREWEGRVRAGGEGLMGWEERLRAFGTEA